MPARDEQLTPERLLNTAFAAYTHAVEGTGEPLTIRSWDQLDVFEQHAFGVAVKAVQDFLEGEEREGVKWSDVAAHAHLHHQRALLDGGVGQEWASLPPAARLIWEAIVRHLANMLELDPAEAGDLSGHEAHWSQWCKDKLENLTSGVR